jgi:hypothetical protein
MPVDGTELFDDDHKSRSPIIILDNVKLIEITKKADTMFDASNAYVSDNTLFLIAIDSEPRKNQKTKTEFIELMAISSPFHEVFLVSDLILLKIYFLKNNPETIPIKMINKGFRELSQR